jgi:type VI secretion system protein ImpJ
VIHSRSFEKDWVDPEKPFTVYLGLRKWSAGGGNVTVVDNVEQAEGVSTMYAAEANPESVPDLYGTGPEAQVQQLTYVLRVFWETELDELGDYSLIAAAQLVRDGENVVLSERFAPPCLNVYAMEQLANLFRDVRDLVVSRSQQLEEYKSPGELQSQDFDVSYMVFLLALRSLNRYVPVFQQLSETPSLHPWVVYMHIRQIVGELSSFSEGVGALGESRDGTPLIPAYDHENLWECFSQAKQVVTQMVESITVGPELLVRFEYADPYYTAELPQRVFDRRNHFWLLLRTRMDPDTVAAEVRHVVKLSATMGMTSLLSRAVSGIPLEHHSDPPTGESPVRAAVVHDSGRVRLGQDHGRGPGPADLHPHRRGARQGRVRDPQLRLVVLRGGHHPGHRGPLHHPRGRGPGQGGGGASRSRPPIRWRAARRLRISSRPWPWPTGTARTCC